MKKNILFLAFTAAAFAASAQPLAKTFTRQELKELQWGARGVDFTMDFWDMALKQLKTKFSKKLVDSIGQYSSSIYQPDGFRALLRTGGDINCYVVAKFNNIYGGTSHGVEYVVLVPYAENKKLWESEKIRTPIDFFLIFPGDAVTLK